MVCLGKVKEGENTELWFAPVWVGSGGEKIGELLHSSTDCQTLRHGSTSERLGLSPRLLGHTAPPATTGTNPMSSWGHWPTLTISWDTPSPPGS